MTAAVASVILVGDELLAGRVADVNGPFLARRLSEWGWRLADIRTVNDDVDAIAGALRHAGGRASLVVVSGGLGPTQDDRTREAIAAVVSDGVLETNRDARAWIEDYFGHSGRAPTPRQARQADVPVGAEVIRNSLGVAPAFLCQKKSTMIVALPGVPAELRSFFGDPAPLTTRLNRIHSDGSIRFMVAGLGETTCESVVASVKEVATWEPSFYPQQGEVEIVLHHATTASDEERTTTFDALRAAFGDHLYEPGVGKHIEHLIVNTLADRGETVATAESLTGGLIAEMLTRVPGASAVFPVGWVTYATEQKSVHLGVAADLIANHGVVSEAVVREMAKGARDRSGATFGLATTGVAGPDPVVAPDRSKIDPGTAWIAVAGKKGVTTHMVQTSAGTGENQEIARAIVKRRVAVAALNELRLVLPSS